MGADSGEANFKDFLDALEYSVCIGRLQWLAFRNCGMDTEDMRSLAGLISQGAVRALKLLVFSRDNTITDLGVIALAEALHKPTQTFWTGLILVDVGMDDEGLTALASLLYQDRFQQLEVLHISHKHGITDKGIIALAHAIEARKLPKLKSFEAKGLDKITCVGFDAIAWCVVSGCPKLKEINLTHTGVIPCVIPYISKWVINCALRAVERDGQVKVNVSAQTEANDG